MSVLDSRFPELDLFLLRVRRRLNRRYLAGEAAAAWLAALPGALGAALVWPGDLGLRYAVGAMVLALSAVGFALWRSRRRLSRPRAAAWLDGTQGTHGLFQASAEALGRDAPQAFDEAILTQANKTRVLLGVDRSVRYPWKRLGLRLTLAALAAGVFVVALPLVPEGLAPRLGLTAQAHPQAEPRSSERLTLGNPGTLSPRETAQRLFPEDPRLAALAEQALTSGDSRALDDLLKANADRVDKAAQGPGAYRERKSQGGRGGLGVPGVGSGPETPGSGSTDGEGAGEPGDQGTASDQKSGGAGASKGPAASGGTGRPSSPGSGEGGNSPSGGGMAPGTGHSDVPLGNRPEAAPSDKSVVIPDRNKPGFFEYVMPGSGARLPLDQALPHAQRTAEAALDRAAAPQEFEQTIQNYFLSLSQEVKP